MATPSGTAHMPERGVGMGVVGSLVFVLDCVGLCVYMPGGRVGERG